MLHNDVGVWIDGRRRQQRRLDLDRAYWFCLRAFAVCVTTHSWFPSFLDWSDNWRSVWFRTSNRISSNTREKTTTRGDTNSDCHASLQHSTAILASRNAQIQSSRHYSYWKSDEKPASMGVTMKPYLWSVIVGAVAIASSAYIDSNWSVSLWLSIKSIDVAISAARMRLSHGS